LLQIYFKKKGCINKIILLTEFDAKKSGGSGARGETPESVSDFPNRRRHQILAGLFAAAAMTGYALSIGLVQVD
jgi:hypothetical protein